MDKRIQRLFFIFLLAGLVFCLPQIGFAAEKQQTIPTRTHTPPPSPPPGDDDPTPQPQPTDQPPPATNTPVADTPEPTATSTPAATFVPTPEGGFWPTAAPCSPLPTVQALGRLNVRSGPGAEYTLLDLLTYLEVRPITGRAQFATWWQIELADGTLGWVSDRFVRVSGYTGQAPIIPAPDLADGSTPVPGALWNPTPNPACTPPPTPTTTPTHTPIPTATATATATSATTAATPETSDSNGRGDTGNIPLSDEPERAEGAANASPPPAIPVAPTAVDEQILITGETDAGAPLDTAASGQANGADSAPSPGFPLGWLPVAGIGLMVAGAAVFIFRRQ